MAENLGEAKVVISADTENLKKQVREAEAEVRKLEKSTKGLGDAFKSAQRTIGRLFVPVAIAGAIAGITKKVIDLITTTQRLQQEFNKVEEQARNIASSMRIEQLRAVEQQGVKLAQQFNDQIEAARAKAEEFRESTAGWWMELFGLSNADAQAQETIRNIQKAQADAQRMLSEQVKRDDEERARRERERIDKTAQQLEDMARDIEIDLLPDAEGIEAKLGETLERIRRRLADEGILSEEQVDAAIRRYERFLRAKADRDQKELADRLAKEERAEIEKAERVAKAAGDAMKRELERAFESISGSLGGDFTNFGDAIAAAIDRNTTALQRRVRP